MTEPGATPPPGAVEAVADPTTEPFWRACLARRLIVQRCAGCGVHQFYPRPFCLACGADAPGWVEVSGGGTVHALTVIRVPVTPELTPPYVVALVDLDEGPRLLANLTGPAAVGDRVALGWRDRPGLPPLPLFRPLPLASR